MRTRILTTVLLTSMAGATTSRAEVLLGSAQVLTGGASQSISDSFPISLGMGADFGDVEIFFVEDYVIDASSLGTTWVSDPATMSLIRDQWVDGDNIDIIGAGTRLVDDPFTPFFFTGIPEFNFSFFGLDLNTIASETDEIRVTLLSLETVTPGEDPNGDGNWTEFEIVYQFDFIAVPAPAGASLFVLGAVPVGRRRRR